MDFLNKMKRPFTTLARGKIKIMLMEGWGRLGVRPNHVICIKVMAYYFLWLSELPAILSLY